MSGNRLPVSARWGVMNYISFKRRAMFHQLVFAQPSHPEALWWAKSPDPPIRFYFQGAGLPISFTDLCQPEGGVNQCQRGRDWGNLLNDSSRSHKGERRQAWLPSASPPGLLHQPALTRLFTKQRDEDVNQHDSHAVTVKMHQNEPRLNGFSNSRAQAKQSNGSK